MYKIYKNNNWSDITDLSIIENFKNFLRFPENNNGQFINEGFYKYYILIENIKYPIADWDNVFVFLTDIDNPRWVNARPYQTWAFYDFIYKNQKEILYASKHSSIRNYIELPFDIVNNIIFKLYYNENGSISYEKDDLNKTNVRISNNNDEMSYYKGFYNRITSEI